MTSSIEISAQTGGEGTGTVEVLEASRKGKEKMYETTSQSSTDPVVGEIEGMGLTSQRSGKQPVHRKLEMESKVSGEQNKPPKAGMKLSFVPPMLKKGVPTACFEKSDIEKETEK